MLYVAKTPEPKQTRRKVQEFAVPPDVYGDIDLFLPRVNSADELPEKMF